MNRQLAKILITKILQRASENYQVRRMFNQPSIKPNLERFLITGLRLIRREVFKGELNGVKIKFYDPGISYWKTFYMGTLYEHSVLKHVKYVAQQFDSPTFLDVGAHYGYYTVYMSGLGGPSSKVFSFEPNNLYFKVLSTNVRLNKRHNVFAKRVALSDKKGIVVLETSQRYKSKGLLQEKRKMKSLDVLKSPQIERMHTYVTAVPFDELSQTEGISPDIVKIDVHGAEGNVIYGMKKTLKKSIAHLYCELHGEMCDGYHAIDVVTALQDAGMETFEFRGFRSKHGKLVEISDDLLSAPHDRMIYARK